MTEVSRYHALLVALHRMLAFPVLRALTLSALVMAAMPSTEPMKIEASRSHLSGGVAILVSLNTVSPAATRRAPN